MVGPLDSDSHFGTCFVSISLVFLYALCLSVVESFTGPWLLRCGKEHGRLAPGGSVALALPVLCLAYFSERPLLAARESSANWGTTVVIVSVH